jgi:hypothetical protein
VRFTWNENAFSWEAIVQPGDDVETGAGPVGPAGVNFVRVGDASVSMCAMTGRVTAAWLPVNPDRREAALYELVFGRTLDPTRFAHGGPPFDDPVLAVSARSELIRWAALSDTLRHIEFGSFDDDSASNDARDETPRALLASLFAHLEHASALIALHGLGPAGSAVATLADIEAQLQVADDLVTQVAAGGPGVLRAARLIKTQGAQRQVRERLESLDFVVLGPAPAPGVAGSMCREITEALLNELRPSAVGGTLGALPLLVDREALDYFPRDQVPPPATELPDLPWDVPVEGGRLTAAASDHLGITGDIAAVPGPGRFDLSMARIARPIRDEHPWVLALAEDRETILGGTELETSGPTATARVFVPDEGQVAWLRFDRNPFGRPNRGVRWPTYGSADTAARAGLALLQRGKAGLMRSITTSGAATLIFTEVAIAWLHLGSQFKAGWSWTLADPEEGLRHLDDLGLSRLEPAMSALRGVPCIPSRDELLPAPLWTLVVDIRTLLPRKPTDLAPEDELFLLPAGRVR